MLMPRLTFSDYAIEVYTLAFKKSEKGLSVTLPIRMLKLAKESGLYLATIKKGLYIKYQLVKKSTEFTERRSIDPFHLEN